MQREPGSSDESRRATESRITDADGQASFLDAVRTLVHGDPVPAQRSDPDAIPVSVPESIPESIPGSIPGPETRPAEAPGSGVPDAPAGEDSSDWLPGQWTAEPVPARPSRRRRASRSEKSAKSPKSARGRRRGRTVDQTVQEGVPGTEVRVKGTQRAPELDAPDPASVADSESDDTLGSVPRPEVDDSGHREAERADADAPTDIEAEGPTELEFAPEPPMPPAARRRERRRAAASARKAAREQARADRVAAKRAAADAATEREAARAQVEAERSAADAQARADRIAAEAQARVERATAKSQRAAQRVAAKTQAKVDRVATKAAARVERAAARADARVGRVAARSEVRTRRAAAKAHAKAEHAAAGIRESPGARGSWRARRRELRREAALATQVAQIVVHGLAPTADPRREDETLEQYLARVEAPALPRRSRRTRPRTPRWFRRTARIAGVAALVAGAAVLPWAAPEIPGLIAGALPDGKEPVVHVEDPPVAPSTDAFVGPVGIKEQAGPFAGVRLEAAGWPREVRIPRLSVDSQVIPISGQTGTLLPPDDPQDLGWWREGKPVGAQYGTTVITGHAVHTGGGALDNLAKLAVGDKLRVRTDDGWIEYAVQRTQVYSKGDLAKDAEELFRLSGPGRLVVVSCDDWNGEFYESNAVVVATPVADEPFGS